jgi:uncharacterized protein YjbI with pentapeptide repeats
VSHWSKIFGAKGSVRLSRPAIRRRDINHDPLHRHLDLHNAHLEDVELYNIHPDGAYLESAGLRSADLSIPGLPDSEAIDWNAW